MWILDAVGLGLKKRSTALIITLKVFVGMHNFSKYYT